MKFLIRTLLLLALFGQYSRADIAHDETYFIKLSKSLRGIPPSFQEREDFRTAVKAGQQQKFIEQKINEFIFSHDGAFIKKMKFKIDELLKVETEITNSMQDFSITKMSDSSYASVVDQVIKNNLPWDNLFLLKKYVVLKTPPSLLFNSLYDFDFFSALMGVQVMPQKADEFFATPGFYYGDPKYEKVTFEFSESDPRIAGIFTTPRFFNRYVNTALNKNRKRAAAIFSTLLCEDMAPTLPTPTEEGEDGDFDILLPNEDGTLAEEDIVNGLGVDPHGTQADCMACHYKLDPMGNVFGLSSASLAPKPSPGHLRYVGKDLRQVDIPVLGPGGLVQAIVQQPEYVACQVNQFWKWYIGKDAILSDVQMKQLVEKFEDVGRKPKDFVAYLVQRDEFKKKPVILNEDQIIARRSAIILKNCNACHVNQDEDLTMKNWDMAQLPYSGTAQEIKAKIRKISRVLDLKNDGKNKSMPPEDSLWKINDDQLVTIKNWIARGAPDFEGKPQVTE